MKKREFVCHTAIAIFSSMPITPNDAWAFAETLWDKRPQWMKDEDQLADEVKQSRPSAVTPLRPGPIENDWGEHDPSFH